MPKLPEMKRRLSKLEKEVAALQGRTREQRVKDYDHKTRPAAKLSVGTSWTCSRTATRSCLWTGYCPLKHMKSIHAIKCVSINEPFFQGHFPSYPVMPGVLILEALAQAGGIMVIKTLPPAETVGKIFPLHRHGKGTLSASGVSRGPAAPACDV
jgi:hypothetical protein